MKKGAIVLIAVVVVVAIAGAAFYGGMKVGENRATQNLAQVRRQGFSGQGGQFPMGQGTPQPGGTPQAGQRGAPGMGGGIMGTIEKIEGNTLVLTTEDGTVRVQTNDTTLIEKFTSVGLDALKVGEQVMASGTKNEDGSYSARSIQSLRGFGDTTPSGTETR